MTYCVLLILVCIFMKVSNDILCVININIRTVDMLRTMNEVKYIERNQVSGTTRITV